MSDLQAVVMGRVGVDLYPGQLETPLEEVDTFHKFVGGFAGNVSTGLARLGVRTAIVSAVGDDGHGRFVRTFLEREGVDCRWLSVHPRLRTDRDVKNVKADERRKLQAELDQLAEKLAKPEYDEATGHE